MWNTVTCSCGSPENSVSKILLWRAERENLSEEGKPVEETVKSFKVFDTLDL